VIALTAANGGSRYVPATRTLRLVRGRRAIINSRRKGFPQRISGRRPDRSKEGNFPGLTPLDPEGLEFTAMRNTITRTTIAGLAALSLMGSLLGTAEPAAAAGSLHGGGGGFHGGGFHGGGGGFHGGGFHGGGWHGGGGGWHGGGGHGGGWNGGWAGPAIVGGLAAGALLGGAYYGGGYGYGGGCGTYAPIYDAYGNYLGQQLVNGC
jgi:hypothetical protein